MVVVKSALRVMALAAALAATACGAAAPGAPAVSASAAGSAAAPSPARPELLLATTTSTQDSGLLDVLIPDFEKKTGYKVKTTAVGTGAALALGAKGDADVVLVHAPSAELDYMKNGNGDRRLLIMHNDFVVIGPASDPAKIKGLKVVDAFTAIAAAKATFISRGDNSGTDILEKALWKQARIVPDKTWYVESGTGMGQSLTVANEKKAYIVTDRATYLARRSTLQLDILVEKDAPLLNIYHVITVNATKFPKVNIAGANAFADYLISPATQQLIGAFGLDKFGQALFVPDAGKKESELGG